MTYRRTGAVAALQQMGLANTAMVSYTPQEMAEQVAEVARNMQALSAQHYGRFMIEDVIDSTAPPVSTS